MNTSRRQWLKTGFRWAAFGTLIAAGGAALHRNHRLLKEGKCVGRSMCNACGQFSDCGLPRARSVRQGMKGQTDG
jgi:hypothetical protein